MSGILPQSGETATTKLSISFPQIVLGSEPCAAYPAASQTEPPMKSKALAISVLVNIGLAVWLAALYAGKRPESATANPSGDHGKPTTHRNADPGNRTGPVKAPLPGLSATDPKSVFQSLRENYNPETIVLAKQTLAKLARESPDELMRLIETEQLFAAGDEWMDAALAALIGARPGELDALAKRFTDLDMRSHFVESAVRVHARSGNWGAAEDLLAKLPPGAMAAARYSQLAWEMGKTDVNLAIGLLGKVDFPEGRSAVMRRLISTLQDHPEKSGPQIEKLLSLAGNDSQNIKSLAELWASEATGRSADPAALLGRIKGLELADAVKADLRSAVAMKAIEASPTADSARTWREQLAADADATSFGVSAAMFLARKDIREATSFVGSLDEKDGLEWAMQGLMMHWLPNDSIAASGWISQLPVESPQRKYATRQLVKYLRRVGDNQAADQWERSLNP